METVIVAFENSKTAWRVKEILEGGGVASCVVCRSADQVRRTLHKLHVPAVVCGYKLGDQTAEVLYDDLPSTCLMLVLASNGMLELLDNEDIFRLPLPITKWDITASVSMLLQVSRRLERRNRPRRDAEQRELIRRAKALLMDERGMTEEQAHRYIQKASMDSRSRLTDTAQLILGRETFE